ncbi:MAG: protein kinase, partial [Planctomycetota bacterium]
MPKQSDIDFANEILRQGVASKGVVEECLALLKNLNDMGVDDALDGIMCLKGHISEAQVSQIWKGVFGRGLDEDGDGVFSLEMFGGAAPAGQPDLPEIAPEITPEIPAPPVESPKAPPEEALPDIPGFKVEAKLEKDSTGINFLGTPEKKKRKAVIHLLYPQVAGDQKIMGWLIKHGRRLARLEHPSAAHFYPVQPLRNQAFFAQEIPLGEALTAVLEDGNLEEERALLLLEQVAEVLLHAEEKKVFHGRLTHQNIFVLDDNLVEVRFFTYTDRERSLFLDEPESEDLPFISPEIRSGTAATVRSDIYSLGKILLRMTGADQEAPKKLGESCRRIIGKMIAINPTSRCPSVKVLLQDLERYFEGKEITAEVAPPAAAPPKKKPAARPPAEKKPAARPPAEKPRAASRPPAPSKPKTPSKPKAPRVPGKPVSKGRKPSGRLREKSPPQPPSRRKTPMPGRGVRPPRGGRPREGVRLEESREAIEELIPSPEDLGVSIGEPPVEGLEEDSRVLKAIELADRREAKGDLAGAIEALQDILDLATDPEPLKERIVDLKDRGFARCRKEARAREAARDYKGAIKVFELARAFIDDHSDIDRVIALLEERHEDEQRKAEMAKLEKKAEARAGQGDFRGAMAVLEEAKEVAANPLAVQAKIDGMRKRAYKARMEECQEREKGGDLEGAITAAQRAREFAENDEAVSTIIKNLERKMEKGSRQVEYQRCEEEAQKRAEEGDIEGAIEWYEKAKKYAVSAITVEAKIEDLRHSTSERFITEAREFEEAGEFKKAILSWEQARPHAPDPEEVEAAIQA